MSTPATQTAHAPVPQASVIPDPRLPRPHRDLARTEDLHDMDVHSLRERRVILDPGTERLQGERARVVDIDHGVRVAHRYDGHCKIAAIDLKRRVDGRLAGQERGNPRRVEDRGTHVHAGPTDVSSVDLQVEREDAAARLDPEPVLPHDVMIVEILGDATDAVTAHLAFGAVGVEHPHPRGVGPLRGHDQDQTVATDPIMAVAHGHRQLGWVGRRRLVERGNIDVIVADPVHLRESHQSIVPLKKSLPNG